MRDPNRTSREHLYSALADWAAAQNITGQVFPLQRRPPAEFDDDPPLNPVRMYERPALHPAKAFGR